MRKAIAILILCSGMFLNRLNNEVQEACIYQESKITYIEFQQIKEQDTIDP